MSQVKECDSQVCNMRMVNLLLAFFFLMDYKSYLMYAYFTIVHSHTAGRRQQNQVNDSKCIGLSCLYKKQLYSQDASSKTIYLSN